MSAFEYPEAAPQVRDHYDGDGCEFEFGPGVHNLGSPPLNKRDAEKLREFYAELRRTDDAKSEQQHCDACDDPACRGFAADAREFAAEQLREAADYEDTNGSTMACARLHERADRLAPR